MDTKFVQFVMFFMFFKFIKFNSFECVGTFNDITHGMAKKEV